MALAMATAAGVVAIAFLLVTLTALPCVRVSRTFRQLHLPPGKVGPETVVVAPDGVLYTDFRDGLIFQYRPLDGWRFFAYTSPYRSGPVCDNTTNRDLGPVCGYPLGLSYDCMTGELYIADPYFGLLKAGPEPGMLATTLATAAKGGPFVATNGIDFDTMTRTVYFTDSSSKYQMRNVTQALRSNDTTGRLMQYDPNTGQVTVLASNLGFANGVAASKDGSFLVVCETSLNRTTKFWLTGPKAGSSEPFITNIVNPDNIRRTLGGQFWIAAKMVVPASESTVPMAVKADEDGTIVERIQLAEEYGSLLVSEVYQPTVAKSYLVSSIFAPFIGIINEET